MTEEMEPPLFDPETLRTNAIELIRRAEHLRDRADEMMRHADELLRQAEEYQPKPEQNAAYSPGGGVHIFT